MAIKADGQARHSSGRTDVTSDVSPKKHVRTTLEPDNPLNVILAIKDAQFENQLQHHRESRVILNGLILDAEEQLREHLSYLGYPPDRAKLYASKIMESFSHATVNKNMSVVATAVALARSSIEVMSHIDRHNLEPAKSWIERDPKNFPTAESFLRHQYATRLGPDGDLTPALLGKLDPPLLTALNTEFKGRLVELHDLLPTLKQRNDAKLVARYGYIPEGTDRKKKLTVMARGEHPRI